jgi:hypothetical protein
MGPKLAAVKYDPQGMCVVSVLYHVVSQANCPLFRPPRKFLVSMSFGEGTGVLFSMPFISETRAFACVFKNVID